LIAKLNPIIRGWAQYHQHVVSKRVLADVEHAIFQAIWRWATRRHPHQGKRWVKDKYFKRVGTRDWVFFGDYDGKEWRLFSTSRLPIKRHIKIKADANPYDPAWELYFEERLSQQMEHTLRGSRQLDYLWREQNGSCPVCQHKLTDDTRWHNHHIVWRSKGGPDTVDNRVLLHPNCHRQVHSQHLFVEKPRPSPGV
jgi:RNA-directed DNA polymerase